jgi:hypothetical protein
MNTCCVHNRDAGRFFGWFAERYRKRFARKGLERSQKHLIEGLTRSGFRSYVHDPAAIDRKLGFDLSNHAHGVYKVP